MPYKPKKPCRKPGCPELVVKGYCAQHQPKRDYSNDNRPSSSFRGYDSKWNRFSKGFLKRHPDCKYCGSKATITDHKIPYVVMKQQYGGNTYQDKDYQPLCVVCNTRKGKNEDKNMIKDYNSGLQTNIVGGHNKSLQQTDVNRRGEFRACTAKTRLRGVHGRG